MEGAGGMLVAAVAIAALCLAVVALVLGVRQGGKHPTGPRQGPGPRGWSVASPS